MTAKTFCTADEKALCPALAGLLVRRTRDVETDIPSYLPSQIAHNEDQFSFFSQ